MSHSRSVIGLSCLGTKNTSCLRGSESSDIFSSTHLRPGIFFPQHIRTFGGVALGAFLHGIYPQYGSVFPLKCFLCCLWQASQGTLRSDIGTFFHVCATFLNLTNSTLQTCGHPLCILFYRRLWLPKPARASPRDRDEELEY